MTSSRPNPVGTLALAACCALTLSACASIRQAVESVRGETPPPEAPAEITPPPAPAPAPEPTPPVAEPPRPAPRSKPKAVTAPAPAPAPAPKAAPSPPPRLPGPAWLNKCAATQVAGGVVRCDTDLLLAKPSPTVQVFTRDPARVVAGQITLRKGLPRVYRLYVVP